jgi:hypothetical protein
MSGRPDLASLQLKAPATPRASLHEVAAKHHGFISAVACAAPQRVRAASFPRRDRQSPKATPS